MDANDLIAMNFLYELDYITNYRDEGFGQGYCDFFQLMVGLSNYIANFLVLFIAHRLFPHKNC